MLGFNGLGRLAIGQADETRAFSLSAGAGSFTLSGVAASVLPQRAIAASTGAFALSGIAVGLPLVMPADAGAFALTGIAVNALATRLASFEAGTFTLTGQEITPRVSMPADTGVFQISGVASVIVQGYVLNAEPYVQFQRDFVGFAALGSVAIGQDRTPGGVTFSLNGQDITPRINMPVEPGAFVLTGPSVTTFGRTRPKIRAFPRVGNPAFSATSRGRDAVKIRAFGG